MCQYIMCVSMVTANKCCYRDRKRYVLCLCYRSLTKLHISYRPVLPFTNSFCFIIYNVYYIQCINAFIIMHLNTLYSSGKSNVTLHCCCMWFPSMKTKYLNNVACTTAFTYYIVCIVYDSYV